MNILQKKNDEIKKTITNEGQVENQENIDNEVESNNVEVNNEENNEVAEVNDTIYDEQGELIEDIEVHDESNGEQITTTTKDAFDLNPSQGTTTTSTTATTPPTGVVVNGGSDREFDLGSASSFSSTQDYNGNQLSNVKK